MRSTCCLLLLVLGVIVKQSQGYGIKGVHSGAVSGSFSSASASSQASAFSSSFSSGGNLAELPKLAGFPASAAYSSAHAGTANAGAGAQAHSGAVSGAWSGAGSAASNGIAGSGSGSYGLGPAVSSGGTSGYGGSGNAVASGNSGHSTYSGGYSAGSSGDGLTNNVIPGSTNGSPSKYTSSGSPSHSNYGGSSAGAGTYASGGEAAKDGACCKGPFPGPNGSIHDYKPAPPGGGGPDPAWLQGGGAAAAVAAPHTPTSYSKPSYTVPTTVTHGSTGLSSSLLHSFPGKPGSIFDSKPATSSGAAATAGAVAHQGCNESNANCSNKLSVGVSSSNQGCSGSSNRNCINQQNSYGASDKTFSNNPASDIPAYSKGCDPSNPSCPSKLSTINIPYNSPSLPSSKGYEPGISLTIFNKLPGSSGSIHDSRPASETPRPVQNCNPVKDVNCHKPLSISSHSIHNYEEYKPGSPGSIFDSKPAFEAQTVPQQADGFPISASFIPSITTEKYKPGSSLSIFNKFPGSPGSIHDSRPASEAQTVPQQAGGFPVSASFIPSITTEKYKPGSSLSIFNKFPGSPGSIHDSRPASRVQSSIQNCHPSNPGCNNAPVSDSLPSRDTYHPGSSINILKKLPGSSGSIYDSKPAVGEQPANQSHFKDKPHSMPTTFSHNQVSYKPGSSLGILGKLPGLSDSLYNSKPTSQFQSVQQKNNYPSISSESLPGQSTPMPGSSIKVLSQLPGPSGSIHDSKPASKYQSKNPSDLSSVSLHNFESYPKITDIPIIPHVGYKVEDHPVPTSSQDHIRTTITSQTPSTSECDRSNPLCHKFSIVSSTSTERPEHTTLKFSSTSIKTEKPVFSTSYKSSPHEVEMNPVDETSQSHSTLKASTSHIPTEKPVYKTSYTSWKSPDYTINKDNTSTNYNSHNAQVDKPSSDSFPKATSPGCSPSSPNCGSKIALTTSKPVYPSGMIPVVVVAPYPYQGCGPSNPSCFKKPSTTNIHPGTKFGGSDVLKPTTSSPFGTKIPIIRHTTPPTGTTSGTHSYGCGPFNPNCANKPSGTYPSTSGTYSGTTATGAPSGPSGTYPSKSGTYSGTTAAGASSGSYQPAYSGKPSNPLDIIHQLPGSKGSIHDSKPTTTSSTYAGATSAAAATANAAAVHHHVTSHPPTNAPEVTIAPGSGASHLIGKLPGPSGSIYSSKPSTSVSSATGASSTAVHTSASGTTPSYPALIHVVLPSAGGPSSHSVSTSSPNCAYTPGVKGCKTSSGSYSESPSQTSYVPTGTQGAYSGSTASANAAAISSELEPPYNKPTTPQVSKPVYEPSSETDTVFAGGATSNPSTPSPYYQSVNPSKTPVNGVCPFGSPDCKKVVNHPEKPTPTSTGSTSYNPGTGHLPIDGSPSISYDGPLDSGSTGCSGSSCNVSPGSHTSSYTAGCTGTSCQGSSSTGPGYATGSVTIQKQSGYNGGISGCTGSSCGSPSPSTSGKPYGGCTGTACGTSSIAYPDSKPSGTYPSVPYSGSVSQPGFVTGSVTVQKPYGGTACSGSSCGSGNQQYIGTPQAGCSGASCGTGYVGSYTPSSSGGCSGASCGGGSSIGGSISYSGHSQIPISGSVSQPGYATVGSGSVGGYNPSSSGGCSGGSCGSGGSISYSGHSDIPHGGSVSQPGYATGDVVIQKQNGCSGSSCDGSSPNTSGSYAHIPDTGSLTVENPKGYANTGNEGCSGGSCTGSPSSSYNGGYAGNTHVITGSPGCSGSSCAGIPSSGSPGDYSGSSADESGYATGSVSVQKHNGEVTNGNDSPGSYTPDGANAGCSGGSCGGSSGSYSQTAASGGIKGKPINSGCGTTGGCSGAEGGAGGNVATSGSYAHSGSVPSAGCANGLCGGGSGSASGAFSSSYSSAGSSAGTGCASGNCGDSSGFGGAYSGSSAFSSAGAGAGFNFPDLSKALGGAFSKAFSGAVAGGSKSSAASYSSAISSAGSSY